MLRDIAHLRAPPVIPTLYQLFPILLLRQERKHRTTHHDANSPQNTRVPKGCLFVKDEIKGHEIGVELPRCVLQHRSSGGLKVVQAVESKKPALGELFIREGADGSFCPFRPGARSRSVSTEEVERLGVKVVGAGDFCVDLAGRGVDLGLVQAEADVAEVGPGAEVEEAGEFPGLFAAAEAEIEYAKGLAGVVSSAGLRAEEAG